MQFLRRIAWARRFARFLYSGAGDFSSFLAIDQRKVEMANPGCLANQRAELHQSLPARVKRIAPPNRCELDHSNGWIESNSTTRTGTNRLGPRGLPAVGRKTRFRHSEEEGGSLSHSFGQISASRCLCLSRGVLVAPGGKSLLSQSFVMVSTLQSGVARRVTLGRLRYESLYP
jgi:hypothetical protein